MTPKRIAEFREMAEQFTAGDPPGCYDGIYDPQLGRDFAELLDEIERLQVLERSRHHVVWHKPDPRGIALVTCNCGRWWALQGPGESVADDYMTHVAAVLNGGAS